MKKINIVDLAVLVFVIALALIFIVAYIVPSKPTQEVILKGRVVENSSDISSEAKARVGQQVYFNGVKDPATLISSEGTGESLVLTLRAPGRIDAAQYVFNGQFVAVGQKAEVHSSFSAKIVITGVYYAKNR